MHEFLFINTTHILKVNGRRKQHTPLPIYYAWIHNALLTLLIMGTIWNMDAYSFHLIPSHLIPSHPIYSHFISLLVYHHTISYAVHHAFDDIGNHGNKVDTIVLRGTSNNSFQLDSRAPCFFVPSLVGSMIRSAIRQYIVGVGSSSYGLLLPTCHLRRNATQLSSSSFYVG